MNRYKFGISLILIGLTFITIQGCGTSKESAQFDTANWKVDTNGCLKKRKSIIEDLDKNYDLFLGKNERGISQLLGPPNQTNLYERGQKFYQYAINCDTLKNAEYLSIRFNALGLANEVMIKQRN